jgi:cell division transport system permease protein
MKITRDVRTHIRRSPYQAIAAVLTMFLTFLVAGVFFLATVTSVVILKYFESKPQITVFFNNKAGQKEADALIKKLVATEKVASTNFVSQDQALDIYKKQNKNDPLLLEMVTADILPASLEVSAKNPTYLSDLETVIKGSDGVEEIVYQRDVVNTLLSWTNAIRIVGSIIAILLGVDSLLIMGTVITMKIALKREEIEILRLVGASPWAIRIPFILEGGIYGLLGSFFASAILVGLMIWLRPNLLSFLGSIPMIGSVLSNPGGTQFILSSSLFVIGNLGIGFFFGSIGSYIALIRFL